MTGPFIIPGQRVLIKLYVTLIRSGYVLIMFDSQTPIVIVAIWIPFAFIAMDMSI